ncbi:MAG: hypothetical protein IPJ03_01980 [Ignavibacteriales bacterium]|nr:hypothetical protein [Ignavibacteriales bacterium]
MDASLYKLFSALSQGFAFAFFTIGVAIAFRWLKYPDLTGDGSFTLGAVVTAKLLDMGFTVWLAIPVSMISGLIAGMLTYSMYRFLKVPKILTGVLMMMALYSVNLRILGRPNLQVLRENSILSILPDTSGYEGAFFGFLLYGFLIIVVSVLSYVFLDSKSGLILRIAGANPKLAILNGISKHRLILGLGLANLFIALSGSLIAQRSYNADIHMGMGQVIVAIAALFIGMILFRKLSASHLIFASIAGSIIYMVLMQLALDIGIQAQDFRLISTLIVLLSILVALKSTKGTVLRKGADIFGID